MDLQTPQGSQGGDLRRGKLHVWALNLTFFLREQSTDRPGPLMGECPSGDRRARACECRGNPLKYGRR
jgi:hypothetical protein